MVQSPPRSEDRCQTCLGTGEAATEYGVRDCPDCGGAGSLPPRNVRVNWRAADIERAMRVGETVDAGHVRWLLDELRTARSALNEIIALSHDSQDQDQIGVRIRFLANRALGLYETSRDPRSAS